MLTRSSPRDCQRPFFVSRGISEVKILKKVKLAFLDILIKFGIHNDFHNIHIKKSQGTFCFVMKAYQKVNFMAYNWDALLAVDKIIRSSEDFVSELRRIQNAITAYFQFS